MKDKIDNAQRLLFTAAFIKYTFQLAFEFSVNRKCEGWEPLIIFILRVWAVVLWRRDKDKIIMGVKPDENTFTIYYSDKSIDVVSREPTKEQREATLPGRALSVESEGAYWLVEYEDRREGVRK